MPLGEERTRRRHAVWVVGIVIIALVALVAWFGTKEEVITHATYGTAVLVSTPPANASVDVPTSLTWEVRAPVGASTTHTAIHWSTTSHPGVFGTDAAPAAAGYEGMLPDYAQGMFALPRTFDGVLMFTAPGTYSYRAHAMIGDLHYWSPEYQLVVE